jgi:Ca-activated chloride channel family protein
MEHNNIKLKIRWEHDQVPAGKETRRGLLIEVSGRELADAARPERPPLNLAMVIDRSGSMGNGSLAAACQAALGISQQLRASDRLSIVTYDDRIDAPLVGIPQDETGRGVTQTAIAQLRPRGTTDLGGGWMMGAKCVAEVMQRNELSAGHVLLLSDGRANVGVTDPAELARHAGEMAARGVSSSCVGIGRGYSPLQLDAIAEAGHGQLHHSEVPDEIVDVVLGELGDLTRVAARQARLRLRAPAGFKLQQLTRFRELGAGHTLEIDLGDVVAGRVRRVACLVGVGGRTEPGEQLRFEARLDWLDEAGKAAVAEREFHLQAVEPAAFDPRAKHRKAAHLIAELWVARMGYDAMVLNEGGRYREAVETFASNDALLENLVAGLEEEVRRTLMRRKAKAQAAVADEWSGAGKLRAFAMAKKFMRSEADHSGRKPADWSDGSRD